MEFISTLASLVKPLFFGIAWVLGGGLGFAVALCGWLQVITISLLAVSQTGTITGAIALAIILLFCQAAAALWSFLIANGSAYNTKASTISSLTATAAVSSALFVAMLASLGAFLVSHFTLVESILTVTAISSVTAAATAALIVLSLANLAKRK